MTFNYSGMILAAGYGKRMMPLTKNIPKPLIEIHGVTLLDNSINFLKKLGCTEIIINIHYHHTQIKNLIFKRNDKINIKLIYEEEILDTGGGFKNASSYFSNSNILVINSDIYWQDDNLTDVELLIKFYLKNNNMHLLLSKKVKSFGIKKISGDFVLQNNKISRFNRGDEIIYYSGLQMLNIDTLKFFSDKKFSFNVVWDYLIDKKSLYGIIMNSNWYHIGDIQGLNLARKLDS